MSNHVINLVNFVRGVEPRRPKDLYTPVQQEIAINRENGLDSTFLLQYDALLRPDFQELFLSRQGEDMELGLWLEMCRPLTEAVGIAWRGRPGFDWDWYVNPGFLPAYTLEQREKLIDEAFRLFYQIFGYYPKVAGSWLLDAHSMAYMSEKYNMDAFCICREQFAVDAYTLWGGYYSGGYYPSRRNMLCPAQTAAYQIRTPVFRMLGIDPIYGYDEHKHNPKLDGCYTMEPYWACGKDRQVMEWYFRSYYTNPALAGSFATTGQENSFGWEKVEAGYRLQVELMKRYIAEGKLRVEKLGKTGADFRKQFAQTPASALSALEDWSGNDLQSVWFSGIRYRANLFRKGDKLYFRDMQCFDERLTEEYFDTPCQQWQASYGNLPLMDNRHWSETDREAALAFDAPVVKIEALKERLEGVLEVSVRFLDGHTGIIQFSQDKIAFWDCGAMRWCFGNARISPKVEENRLVCHGYDMDYGVIITGSVQEKVGDFLVTPIQAQIEFCVFTSERC